MRMRHVALVALLLAAAGPAPAEEARTEYLVILMEGGKVGHAEEVRTVAEGNVTTRTEMEMTIERMGTPLRVVVVTEIMETVGGEPLGFHVRQDLGLMVMETSGTVRDGTLTVTQDSMGQTRKETVPWPEGAVMDEGLRLRLLQEGLDEGTKFDVRVFDPSSARALDTHVEVGPREPVDLLGRVVTLTRTVITMRSMMGEIRTVNWVDETGNVMRSQTPVLGTNLEMVAAPKEVALSPNDVVDFFDRMLLDSPRPLTGIGRAGSATYTLVPTGGKDLDIPETDNQRVKPGAEGARKVTVHPVDPPSGAPIRYSGNDPEVRQALKPSRYVQSDDPEIVARARQIVGDAEDAGEAISRIEAFVSLHIHEKGLSVGYASASEVLRSGQGDCTEHAVLTAALCRAAGIPAQVVMGVAYVPEFQGRRHVFGPHAWNRAYVGGRWVGLDAALRGAYDPGHIALAFGDGSDPGQFFSMLNTLGYFRIAEAEISE